MFSEADQIAQHYLDTFFLLQRLQGENYAAGAKHDLNHADSLLFEILGGAPPELFHGRQQTVWQQIRTRGLVDKHPSVTALRNRLDDWDNYSGDLDDALDRRQWRLRLARQMQPDVLKLISLRNELAQAQGYNSYVELVMFCEEVDMDWLNHLIEAYLRDNLDQARRLIATYGMTWQNWFERLSEITKTPLEIESKDWAKQLLRRLGLTHAWPHIKVRPQEQPIQGIAIPVAIPTDVRILLKPPQSLHAVTTLFHELGHGLAHALNREKGLYQTWTAAHDETMAVTVEQIGIEIMLEPEQQRLTREAALLENVRTAISFQFELALIQEPDRAEELYLEHYGRLGLPIEHPELWALDSFRSIDPVYIHNYVLGALLAEQTLSYLKHCFRDDLPAWGVWLEEQYFATGRRESLQDKLAKLLR